MARRSYKSRAGRNYQRTSAQEYARRHIEEAREFSRELGGHDKDVKEYFFSLSPQTLESVFQHYGKRFGVDKEGYARDAYSRWKSGRTQMSGVVAKRLFGLLPEFMPLSQKYLLAGNLWRHFGPNSSHDFVVGPDVDVEQLGAIIRDKLQEVVRTYNVPDNVKQRFAWLSGGDVNVNEQLLNHFRQQERELVLEKLRAEIPVLQRHIKESSAVVKQMKQTLSVQKHVIQIWIDKTAGATIKEGRPIDTTNITGSGWFWFVVAVIIALLILSSG